MRAVSFLPILIVIGFFLIIDWYTFRGVRILTEDWNAGLRKTFVYGHWAIFAVFAVWTLMAFLNADAMANYKNYKYYYFLFGLTILFYMPKMVLAVFQLIDDLQLAVRYAFSWVSPGKADGGTQVISRAKFLYQTGIVLASIPFIGAAYGMLKGRFDFRVVRETLKFSNLPKAFHGLTVVQISDAHLGSFFNNSKPVERAIEIINDLEADIVVFTGDLVNNFSTEAEDWIEAFSKIKAKEGKFSILGNHDYGDYGRWKSDADKRANLERLYEIHQEMGFTLLRNEHAKLSREQEEIAILGVENWGVPPFPQKGDVNQAKRGAENAPFKLMLSHDPSHWDAVTLKEHKDIDLTLSGHTHGAQFGVELGNIKWSPVKYKYRRWGGLYQEAKQYLYVNRGFGYIGFPGRVGMPPEITLLTLETA